jgi:hypothetical protein
MSQYTDTFQMGVTNIVVGTTVANNVQIMPGRCVNGGFFKIASGGGTLAIVNSIGVTYSTGYVLGGSEVVSFQGPATFFLAASGATMTVAYVQSYNMGFSLLP